MISKDFDILQSLRAFVDIELEEFSGIRPGTHNGHILEVAGPSIMEAWGSEYAPLWMSVHKLTPTTRLTAWYLIDQLTEDASYPAKGVPQMVVWIERPIVPLQVESLLETPGFYYPEGIPHFQVWNSRGLCLRYSQRSRLPTLLFGFPQMSKATFEDLYDSYIRS